MRMVRCPEEGCHELMEEGKVDCGRHKRGAVVSQKHPCFCGKTTVPHSFKYGDCCRPKTDWKSYKRRYKSSLQEYPQIEVMSPQPRRTLEPIMTHAEQRMIDMEIEVRMSQRSGCFNSVPRSLSRKEIDALVRSGQVTPISKVKKKSYIGNEPAGW